MAIIHAAIHVEDKFIRNNQIRGTMTDFFSQLE
jgi:hypothetical protein